MPCPQCRSDLSEIRSHARGRVEALVEPPSRFRQLELMVSGNTSRYGARFTFDDQSTGQVVMAAIILTPDIPVKTERNRIEKR